MSAFYSNPLRRFTISPSRSKKRIIFTIADVRLRRTFFIFRFPFNYVLFQFLNALLSLNSCFPFYTPIKHCNKLNISNKANIPPRRFSAQESSVPYTVSTYRLLHLRFALEQQAPRSNCLGWLCACIFVYFGEICLLSRPICWALERVLGRG